ncbi:hypothetical protein [Lentzea nigeriaca]|uniref:hypothetical protein n=1 Tax=Lentzea nigeriaca TaxID=1128665 RepID=UPI00195AF400|nr:hypothetical protein [Lentzea nigeriaca]MBM7863729.1 hypothetical protein [Lentzea nigeriaca]
MHRRPVDANGNSVGTAGQVLPTVAGMGGIALIVTACVHQLLLPRKVSHRPEGTSASEIEQALTARARRAEARKLAATDPLLAHELLVEWTCRWRPGTGIGRSPCPVDPEARTGWGALKGPRSLCNGEVRHCRTRQRVATMDR